MTLDPELLPSNLSTHPGPISVALIRDYIPKLDAPHVLELGTKRWDARIPTHHKHWAPNAASYTLTDFDDGHDVDVVADAHRLSDVFGVDGKDLIIACSVWEHLELPWICAIEAWKVLRPGGLIYIQAPHAFPVHGYPSDYGRWTDKGLDAMFIWAGFTRIRSGYAYRAQLIPPPDVTRWNPAAEVWLNVEGLYRK